MNLFFGLLVCIALPKMLFTAISLIGRIIAIALPNSYSIINITGRFSPAALSYDEWGGLYKEADRYLHVSTGIGSNVGFRFGAWPEIDVISLKTK